MERRTSTELIEEFLSLKGATILDVGCGSGWLTRFLAAKGAHVTGIEVSPRQLALARATKPVGDEHYIQGSAEDLQVANRSVDIVIYFNSLHHLDATSLPKALREAARVLKPGGILYVSEPLAEGPYFDLLKIIHDETEVRRRAQEALRHGPEYGLILERTFVHMDQVVLADFNAFRDRLTSINPEVRARFDDEEVALREMFERNGTQTAEGWAFDQPYRVALLRRG